MATLSPEDRALLARAYSLLSWADAHWHVHIYEGSPAVGFLSRIDALLGDIRARLQSEPSGGLDASD